MKKQIAQVQVSMAAILPALLISLAGPALALEPPATLEIVKVFGFRKLVLPVPTAILWSRPAAGPEGTRKVLRPPQVKPFRGFCVLEFPELPGGWRKNGLAGGRLQSRIEHLSGVTTPKMAIDHFQLQAGPLSELKSEPKDGEEAWKGVEVRDFPIGKVVSIDVAKLGWAPGNTILYVILRRLPGVSREEGTLCISPGHFLDFDWARASWTPGPELDQ